MTELINISTNAQGASVVSARDLYAFLEVKQQFADWIKNRISKYDFVEGQDYALEPGFSKNLEKPGSSFQTGGFTKILVSDGSDGNFHKVMKDNQRGPLPIDYVLTLDMAKELSMVERNAKGKQARQYFIDCEKKLHGYDLRTLHTIDRYLTPLLADQQRQINTLQDEVGRLAGLVEQAVQKQPVGGSIPHQANADRQHREVVPPVSQNRAIIGIPPYRPAHPRTGVDLRTPSYVVEQYQHIQRLRRQGYKGAQLASKVGLSKGQVSKIESRFRSISYRPAYCIKLIVPSVRLYRHTSRD